MAKQYPYTLFSCPCTENSTVPQQFDRIPKDDDASQEDQPFDPHSPRARFALYPLEYLLFCNECHEIRCPRCYYEEALFYYCPNCLFEVSGNIVKTETNRCTRSCFQCPVCVAQLAIQTLAPSAEEKSQSSTEATSTRDAPCMLACHYCSWTSLGVGLKFDRPINISGQLAKMLAPPAPPQPSQEPPTPRDPGSRSFSESIRTPDPYLNKPPPTDQFLQLAAFYKTQIAETSPAGPLGLGFSSSFGIDSPSQLSRLLTTYGVSGLKKQRGPVPVMREALAESEGIRNDDFEAEDAAIERTRTQGWDATTTAEQQIHQAHQQRNDRTYRFASDLVPLATQLRSKRAKRCRTCRHNLVKPDEKRQRNKYSIRLVALNYLPSAILKPLDPSAGIDLRALQPMKTVQFMLTMRNALFDAVNVTLATPQETPGRVKSKVTILCPQFTIGANADVWDEALEGSGGVEEERRKAREGLEGPVAEAGKVWKKGRNWTAVVVEVVPGLIPMKNGEEEERSAPVNDDVLEIPIFVRMEYDAEESATSALSEKSQQGKGERVKREIAYWCVVGVGKIAG